MRAASAARPATGALRNEASCSLLSVRHEAAAAAPRRPPRAHPTRHSHSFGLRGGIRENALYISDSSIIYPVGAHVAVTHLDKREQQFLDLPRGVRSIDAMQTSPLQGSSVLASKYVALCEQAQASAGGPVHAQVRGRPAAQAAFSPCGNVPKPHSLRFRAAGHRLLAGAAQEAANGGDADAAPCVPARRAASSSVQGRSSPCGFLRARAAGRCWPQCIHRRVDAAAFSTCAFSSDTKLLATLTADPDNQIAMWKWGGEKVGRRPPATHCLASPTLLHPHAPPAYCPRAHADGGHAGAVPPAE